MENVSKYCYDNGVLINNFNIMNINDLKIAEVDATTKRISELKYIESRFSELDKNNPDNVDISGVNFLFRNCFDINMYLFIHYYIFQDVYPFAGQIRDEAIYKSNAPYFSGKTPFCYPSFIYSNLDYYLKEMRDNVRKIKTREDLIKYISYYYGEINVIHPFREGNGRTLRMYMEILVHYLNRFLSIPDMEIHYSLWDAKDRENLLKATIFSTINGDTSLLEACFDKVLVFSNEEKNKRL